MATGHAETRLRLFFAVSILSGSLGIVAGWRFQPQLPTLSIYLTVGVPLAVMAAYLIVSFLSDRTILSTAQFADSIYYLGFLFTLISLTVSLLAFINDTARGHDISGVVNRFGVALLTTVVGLGLRIYLVNFRTSIDDSLAQTEAALADTGEALRQKLEQLSVDMTVQSKLMNESLRGAIDLTSSELTETAKAGRSAVKKTTSAIATAVKTSTEKIAKAAEKGGESLDASFKSYAGKVGASPLPAHLFRDTIEPSVSKLVKTLATYSEALEAASPKHEHAASAVEQLAGSVERLKDGGTELVKAMETIQKGAGELEDFAKSLDTIGSAIGRLVEGLDGHEKAIAEMKGQLERDAHTVEDHRANIRNNLKESQAALVTVRDEMVSAARYVREELGSGQR